MALGDQSKALIIISKAKGWDPNVIAARGEHPAHDISSFNKAPDPWLTGAQTIGSFQEAIPPQQGMFPAATEGALTPPGTMEVPFSTSPQTLNRSRATKGADPFSGMGGTGV